MSPSDFVNGIAPEPWVGESRIPWADASFSARMLREHLDPTHDRASRPAPFIERQVAWLHGVLAEQAPASVLDLGCGPGLYCGRLADLGHRCTGVDIGPASIDHARAENHRGGRCEYHLADFRQLALGRRFDAAMLLSGELNAFSPCDAREILERAAAHVEPGGLLILEGHGPADVERIGQVPASWYRAARGVFSDSPHLVFKEPRWHPRHRATVEAYLVLSGDGGARTYVATLQSYEDSELDALLTAAGFTAIDRGSGFPVQEGAYALVARRMGPDRSD